MLVHWLTIVLSVPLVHYQLLLVCTALSSSGQAVQVLQNTRANVTLRVLNSMCSSCWRVDRHHQRYDPITICLCQMTRNTQLLHEANHVYYLQVKKLDDNFPAHFLVVFSSCKRWAFSSNMNIQRHRSSTSLRWYTDTWWWCAGGRLSMMGLHLPAK